MGKVTGDRGEKEEGNNKLEKEDRMGVILLCPLLSKPCAMYSTYTFYLDIRAVRFIFG